jgi:hypothetical protein
LVPISSGESVTFYCDNAHETTLDQFLALYAETGNASMQALMNAWRTSAAALESLSKEAQSNGHHKAVEVFQKHIGNLEARIELLRTAGQQKPTNNTSSTESKA